MYRYRLPLFLLAIIIAHFLYTANLWINYASPSGDENVHIVSGYLRDKYSDFTMGAYQPPLTNMIQALPLTFLNIHTPFGHVSWQENNWHVFTDIMIYDANDPATVDKIFVWPRWMAVGLTLALAGLIGRWAFKASGWWGAVLALAMFLCEPNVIAHGASARIDMGSVAFTMLALFLFQRFLNRPSSARAWACGLGFGMAMMTRSYALVLGPIFLLGGLWSLWLSPRQLALRDWGGTRAGTLLKFLGILSISFVLCVLLIYRFEFRPLFDHIPKSEEKLALLNAAVGNHPALRQKIHTLLYTVPIPAKSYWMSWPYIVKTLINPYYKVSYDPHINVHRDRWYCLVNLLRKTPLGFTGLFMLSLALIGTRPKIKKNFTVRLVLGCWSYVFLQFVLMQNYHGNNHVLLLYPLTALLSAVVISLALAEKPSRRWTLIVIGLALSIPLEAHMVAPNYLAFYNVASGGPSEAVWRFTNRDPEVDFSNYADLDWGQNFKHLQALLTEKKIGQIFVSPEHAENSQRNFAHYQIRYQTMTVAQMQRAPKPGWYFVGLRTAQVIPVLERTKPTTIVGYSTGLYYVDHP